MKVPNCEYCGKRAVDSYQADDWLRCVVTQVGTKRKKAVVFCSSECKIAYKQLDPYFPEAVCGKCCRKPVNGKDYDSWEHYGNKRYCSTNCYNFHLNEMSKRRGTCDCDSPDHLSPKCCHICYRKPSKYEDINQWLVCFDETDETKHWFCCQRCYAAGMEMFKLAKVTVINTIKNRDNTYTHTMSFDTTQQKPGYDPSIDERMTPWDHWWLKDRKIIWPVNGKNIFDEDSSAEGKI